MTLFKSKLRKLEAFVDTKADERKPAQLAEAQAELDQLQAGVILVPKTDTVKSAEDLQKHLDTLTKDAADAKAAEQTAKEALAKLSGTRVVDTARATADKKEGGDRHGEPSAEKKAEAVVNDPTAPWNAMADQMGFGVPAAAAPETEEKPTKDDQ